MAFDLSGLSNIVEEPAAPTPTQSPSSSAGPSAPMNIGKGTLDATALSRLSTMVEEPPPVEAHPPHSPQPVPYEPQRRAQEATSEAQYWAGLSAAAQVPVKTKLEYLSNLKETPNVDLSGLKEAPMAAAYQLARLAEQDGYQVVFQSGARHKGGGSYHDHGEAVDVRFLKRQSDGSTLELTTKENVALGKKYGAAAGWASALDEFHYWSDGTRKSDPWNQAPHVHLAWGNERNIPAGDFHHLLHKRHHTDADYLALPTYKGPAAPISPTPKGAPRQDRDGFWGVVEVMAKANGIDPDIAVRWINAESGGKMDAVSEKGAMGLVQMMPDTLKEVAPKVGITEEEFHKSPKAQLKAGMYYLKQKLKETGGNYAQALAAYNAGTGGLQAIKEGADYAETREYVHRILKDVDPAVKDSASALAAIRNGGIRTSDPKKNSQFVADTVTNVQKETKSLWDSFMEAAQMASPLKSAQANWEDPTSPGRRAMSFFNELLNDNTFKIIPMAASSKESQQAGDEILKAAREGGDPLEMVMGYATPALMGITRLAAQVYTGGILTRAMRLTPGLGKILSSADDLAASGAGNIAAKGGSFWDTVKGVVSGGPGELLAASMLEQSAFGMLAGGTMKAAEYFHTTEDTGMTFMKNLIGHYIGGGVMGMVAGAGTAALAPVIGSVGLTAANRLTGLGSHNMADNLVTTMGNQFGQMGFAQRTLAGAFGGAATGSLVAATEHALGLGSEEGGMGGDMLAGLQTGGMVGGVLGFGSPVVSKAMTALARSKLLQNPLMQPMLAKAQEVVKGWNDKAIRVAGQEVMDAIKELRAYQQKGTSVANAKLYSIGVQQNLDEVEQVITQRQTNYHNMQGKLIESEQVGKHFEDALTNVLPARYPNAAAHESEMARLQGMLQAVQAKGAAATAAEKQTAAMMAKELQKLEVAATKNKPLQQEMGLFKRERDILVRRQSEWAAQHQFLQKGMAGEEAILKGLEVRKSLMDQAKTQTDDLISKVMAGTHNVDDLRDIQFHMKLDFPGLRSKDPRNLFVPEGGAPIVEEEYAAFMSRQAREMIRAGKIPMGKELIASQAMRAGLDTTPDEFVGTATRRIADLRAQITNTEAGRFGKTRIYTPSEARAWQKGTESAVDWDLSSIPRNHRVVTANPAALRSALIEKLEAGGAAVDRATIFADAGKLVEQRMSSLKNKLPAYDESDLMTLLKDAESAIRLGEAEMPVIISKDKYKDFAEMVKRGGAAHQDATKKELLDMVKRLEDDVRGVGSHKGFIAAMVPGAEGFEGEALLDNALNSMATWESIGARINAVSSAYKAKVGILSEEQQFHDFIKTGNVSLLPKEAEAWVKAGGDLSKAPPSVKKWSEALTALRTEEVARLRRLQELIVGKTEQGELVLSKARIALAAGYEPIESGATPKSFFANLQQYFDEDSIMNRRINEQIGAIMQGDNPPLFDQILPLTREFYADTVHNRLNAVAYVKERAIRPEWNRLTQEFKTKASARKVVIDDEKFNREFMNAVENPGKLEKFKADYPEAEEMVNFYYGMQRQIESIVAGSPKLTPWVQANYFPLRFRKLASHAAAMKDEEMMSLSSAIASGKHLGKARTLEEVEALVETARKDVLAAGFASEEEFLNMDGIQRAMRMKLPKSSNMEKDWAALPEAERKAAEKLATEKVATLLLQDPITNPLELIEMQLSSVARADAQRIFVEGMMRTPAITGKDGSTSHNMIAVHQGAALKAFGADGVEQTYQRLDQIPGLHNVKVDFGGKTYRSSELAAHPEVFRFLKDYAVGSAYSDNTILRGIQRIQGLFRGVQLLGTFIPHAMNTQGSHMMDFMMSPLKMMKMTVGGAALGQDVIDDAAMTAMAIRNGLNIRTLEQGAGYIAKGVLQEFGPDVTASLYGVEKNEFMRLLQSLEPGDPKHKMALQELSGVGKAISSIVGVPTHIDYMVNTQMLFKPIEMGQKAGFYLRAQKILAENEKLLTSQGISHEEQVRMAMKESAKTVNALAGATSTIYQSKASRDAAHALFTTPTWLLSKAGMIVDGLDAVGYMGSKLLSKEGKGVSLLDKLANRRPYDHLPEAVRDETRKRMIKIVAGGLLGSIAMTQAVQYFYDGSTTFSHPPDKLFHIKLGDQYYTGPMYGYMKDLIKFGVSMSHNQGEFSYSMPGVQRLVDASLEAFSRQINPSFTDGYKFLTSRHSENLGAMDAAAEWANGMTREVFKTPLEILGIDSNQFNWKDLHGYTGLGGEESKNTAGAAMSRPDQHILRQAGIYASPDNLEMQVRGVTYDKIRDMESQQRQLLRPLLRKARLSESPAEQQQYMAQFYDGLAKGYNVRDKSLIQYFPGGVFRLTQKQAESMIQEEFAPAGKAMSGSGTQAVITAQILAELGR